MLPARNNQRLAAVLNLSAVLAIVVLTFVGLVTAAAVIAIMWLLAVAGGYIREKRRGRRL